MTVLEVIRRSSGFLKDKGVESPRLQIELMLAHLLQTARLNLYLQFERTLSDDQVAQLREWVRRRGQREPLQHLLGQTSFFGHEFWVNRHALVPRPETELLVERAKLFCNGRDGKPSEVLDFGTGSGCIALSVAVECPQVRVLGVDISPEALALAGRNAQRLEVVDRVQFHLGDGFGALPDRVRFDLILSNPPYIPSGVIGELEPEVRDYDPRLALDGGEEGIDFYRRLALEAGDWLAPGGKLICEIGDDQLSSCRSVFEAQSWVVDRVTSDYSGVPRVLELGRQRG